MGVNLTEWARAQGVHPQTARRWFREGTLPMPARRVGPRTILVNVEANAAARLTGGVGLYARVSYRLLHEGRSKGRAVITPDA